MKKTWNIPEMTELDIKATAAGGEGENVDHCLATNGPLLGENNCS